MRLPTTRRSATRPPRAKDLAEAAAALTPLEEARLSKRLAYEPHIDGLRALAVTAVIVFHAFPGLLPGGYVGVDVFFVISGYLISRIILTDLNADTFSVWEFYRRRIRRIFPALALVLASGLLVGWVVLLQGEWESLGQQVAAGAFFFSNLVFMDGRAYFAAPAESTPFLHLWSLAIEEQFYLIWPLFLILAYRLRSDGFWLLPLVAIGSFAGYYLIEDKDRAFYCTASRVWQLTIGGIIAWGSSCPTQPLRRLLDSASPTLKSAQPLLPAVGLALIIVSTAWLNKFTPYPGAAALAPTLGAALILIGGATSTVNLRLLTPPLLVAIGIISYPLYLWHWPLLAFAKILDPEATSTLVRLVLVCLAVILSVATYRLLELPVRRLGPVVIVALVWVVGALGVTGHYARLGRFAPLSASQHDAKVASEAQADWAFPPRSLSPMLANESTFYGSAGARPGVLFLGDSHVQQYAPRVDAIAEAGPGATRTVLFATHGGCPPIRGIEADARPDCRAFLRSAMLAAASSDFTTVVIGAAWHSYFSMNNGYYFVRNDGTREPLGPGTRGANDAVASLGAMIRELRSAGKEVVLLLNLPIGPEFDPALGVSRPLVGRLLPPPKSSRSREQVDQMLKNVNEPIVEVARLTGAGIIDPVEHLCSANTCSQFDSVGAPRYKDATHLRASYVRREVDFLDSLIVHGAR